MVAFFCKIVCIKCSLYENNLYICDVIIKQYDIKLMKIELQKESKWEVTVNDFKDYYWIRVDGLPRDLAYTEAEAYVKYNAFKEKYVVKEKVTLITEDLELEIPSSKFTDLETTIK